MIETALNGCLCELLLVKSNCIRENMRNVVYKTRPSTSHGFELLINYDSICLTWGEPLILMLNGRWNLCKFFLKSIHVLGVNCTVLDNLKEWICLACEMLYKNLGVFNVSMSEPW